MKAIGIGAGIVGLGCALWLGISGGITPGEATAPVVAVNAAEQTFDYETASLEARKVWLTEQAEPMAKMFDRTLPKGDGAQPHMSVRGWAVDARRRAIEVTVQVKGKYGIDLRAIPAAKKAMVAQVCPSYASSPLGANKVNLTHSFQDRNGREELSVVISPIVCRAFM